MLNVRLVAVALLVSGLLVGLPGQAHGQMARFTDGPCRFTPGKGFKQEVNLRCGTLTVPENPAVPTGPQVHLAVAVFRTPSTHRLSDPVVFLQGGPGGAIVSSLGAAINSHNARAFMGDHDLILVDQRGTGLSWPRLSCKQLQRIDVQTRNQNLTVQQNITLSKRGFAACRRKLLQRGIDPAAYTTANDAADIASLRVALGIRAMDLYGVSYGTRLALAIMRSYPAGIRSVVLDSIVPPQYNIITDAVSAYGRVLNTLFDGCAQATHCRHDHPDLARTFDLLINRLNQHPVHFQARVYGSGHSYSVLMNGDGFSDFIHSALYATPLIPYLPEYIDLVNHGDLRPLQVLYDPLVNGVDIAVGVYESTTCSDDARYATLSALRQAVASLPEALRAHTLIEQRALLKICRAWSVPPAGTAARQPVTSSIPTLLLGGEYDPITPPIATKTTAAALTDAYSFVFPGTGHGVRFSNACPDGIIDAFYNDPRRPPDARCIGRMREPFS